MRIGYACLTLGVPETTLKKCLLKNATPERLHQLIGDNLHALERMIDYNIQNRIRLFRISSDIIPFASSPVNTVPWAEAFAEQLDTIGQKIIRSGMRVSMHPGQYTVLNSPSEQTATSAAMELAYHARFLDSLGVNSTHKIILHVGGAYGDKPAAMERFASRYAALDDAAKARLVIENDDTLYHVEDVLAIGRANGIPVVFDNLHNAVNPSPLSESDRYWVSECAKTWSARDGAQKIHYSQPDPEKKMGAHSQSISIEGFLSYLNAISPLHPDVMLEVKDKNISALKCILCMSAEPAIGVLEREWGRYKYLVLEHSQSHYLQVRSILKDKKAYPALPMFQEIEAALRLPVEIGDAVNAATHVWGYFKDTATPSQKAAFHKELRAFQDGSAPLERVKHALWKLAQTYQEAYLMQSYYFV